MRSFDRLRTHPSLLITAIIVLLTAHGMALYLFRHVALSATVALGMIILIVFKHLGLLAPALAMIRRRFNWRERRDSNQRPPA